MFARIAIVAAALAAVPSAFAAEVTLDDLARETGVSKRHILMVVGPPTPYAEYRYATTRVERQLKSALGEEGYERLLQHDLPTALAFHRARAAQKDTAVAQAETPAPPTPRSEG